MQCDHDVQYLDTDRLFCADSAERQDHLFPAPPLSVSYVPRSTARQPSVLPHLNTTPSATMPPRSGATLPHDSPCAGIAYLLQKFASLRRENAYSTQKNVWLSLFIRQCFSDKDRCSWWVHLDKCSLCNESHRSSRVRTGHV